VVIAQVLATLRAYGRSCNVRYLKTRRGSEYGVAKDGFDGGAMEIASGSGCDGAGVDGVSGGGNAGGGGGGDYEVRDASDARRSWVVRESRGREDRGPSRRRRVHERRIDGRVGDVGCDYSVEEKGMCRRVGRIVEDERLQQRQRQKCQCQAASLYRDAGDNGQALWMGRATCCDCASGADDAAQHSRLLKWPPTRVISLIQPSRKAHDVSKCLADCLWVEDWLFKVQVRLSLADDERPARDSAAHPRLLYLVHEQKHLQCCIAGHTIATAGKAMQQMYFTSPRPPRPNNVPCLAALKENLVCADPSI